MRPTAFDGLNPCAMSTRSWPSRKSVIMLSSSSEKRSKDSSALRLVEIFSPHNASNLFLYRESRCAPTLREDPDVAGRRFLVTYENLEPGLIFKPAICHVILKRGYDWVASSREKLTRKN